MDRMLKIWAGFYHLASNSSKQYDWQESAETKQGKQTVYQEVKNQVNKD